MCMYVYKYVCGVLEFWIILQEYVHFIILLHLLSIPCDCSSLLRVLLNPFIHKI